MLKLRNFFIASFVLSVSLLMGEIREIDSIDAVEPEAARGAVVLFDIDETLIETPIMLGGKAWRRYAKSVLGRVHTPEKAAEIHDKMTYFIAKQVPYIAIEQKARGCLEKLRRQEIPVYGFTARGKEHWYDMPSPDGEALGVLHLKQAGFDFTSSNGQDLTSHWSYGQGIFFAYPIEDKGELILDLFSQTDFRPSKVVFIDDKMENIRSMDKALGQLGIPAVCFYYRHIDLYRPFDPLAAHIQLEKLLFEGNTLSNGEAAALKEKYADKDPDLFFLELAAQFLKR